MNLKNAVVFVTGANRGIGLSFAREALARGARKVYAAARDPASVTLDGVVPIRLDVTDAAQIEAAAKACGDVTLLVNNAGIAQFGSFLEADAVESARRQIETNYFGPLLMTRAFAPILAKNGGGGVINVLSIASWVTRPALAVYASSKSATWGLTNGLRNDLRGQGTHMLGLHMGFVDTDMTKGIDQPKVSPDVVVQMTYDGLEAGLGEVLVDERTRMVHARLSASVYLDAPAG